MKVLVCVPTYDEARSLPLLLGRIRALPGDPVDVLVLDDASPDGTGAVADALAATDPRLAVLHRPGKQGLGAAYKAGFRYALERGYDVVVQMDADGSHAPEDLPRLLAALDRADVVLGSRWVPGGKVVDWPVRRSVLSRGGNAYTRLLLGLPVRDATGGYRAYRRAVIDGVDLDGISSAGYCFQVDMVLRAHTAGFLVTEVPITFVERVHGVSKMSGAIVREALRNVTVWGLRRRFRRA